MLGTSLGIEAMTDDSCWNPGHHRVRLNILGDDRARGNDRASANRDPSHYQGAVPYPHVICNPSS